MPDLAHSRRNFLMRAGAFVACAPAIVSAASLMPVKALELWPYIERFVTITIDPGVINWRLLARGQIIAMGGDLKWMEDVHYYGNQRHA